MKEKTKRTGRIPKLNPKTHCVMVRFDDEEHARFLTMYEQSGEYAKAVFIKARVFGEEFKVIKVDNSFPEYYARLSDLNAQFRRIGVNYNQVVRELKSRFYMKNRHKAQRKAKFYINKCRSASCMQSGWKQASA